jgi:hypothetical protein
LGHRADFYEIEIVTPGHIECAWERDDSELLGVLTDETDLPSPDLVIDAQVLGRDGLSSEKYRDAARKILCCSHHELTTVDAYSSKVVLPFFGAHGSPMVTPSRLKYFSPIAVNHRPQVIDGAGIATGVFICEICAVFTILVKEIRFRHAPLLCGADGGTRTHTAFGPRILSPVRLPIPPRRQVDMDDAILSRGHPGPCGVEMPI